MKTNCSHCFKELPHQAEEKISRNDVCPHCSADLRSCKMCMHYDPHSYNECREPIAERVVDKDKANFCDFFRFSHQGEKKQEKENLWEEASKIFKER